MVKGRRICRICRRGSLTLATLFLLPWAGGHILEAWQSDAPGTVAAQTPQMPVDDRLAEPVLPESPTQVDIGRNLYYFHCMPCHGAEARGDTGIGPNLTDSEWTYGSGSIEDIVATVTDGTDKGMPTFASLGTGKVGKVSAFVLSLGAK